MSKQTADDLRAARKLIERPEAWTKEVFARGKQRRRVSPVGKAAVCWCAWGAVWRVTDSNQDRQARAMGALVRQLPEPFLTVAGFNDHATTHADILALFDRAIAAEEAAP